MARTYTVNILIKGTDKASAPLKKFGSSLRGVGTIIAGILGAGLFRRLAQGIANVGKDIFNSVAAYEQMGFSIEALVARELKRGTIQEQVSFQIVNLTNAERLALIDLEARQLTLAEQVKITNVAHEEAVRLYGEGSREALTLAVELDGYNKSVADTTVMISNLNAKNGMMVETLNQVRIGQMSMTEAMKLAGPEVKNLLGWIEELAIASPFDVKSVQNSIRTMMTYGMLKDEAKRATFAIVDFAAATGLSTDSLDRISLALGQVSSKGRLMGQEVRQLAEAGIPVLNILSEHYGKTTKEVQKMMEQGLLPANEVIDAILQSLEEDYAGAGERQLETWKGITNSFSDIKMLGMAKLFTGMGEAFKPFFTMFVNFMRSEDSGGGGGLASLAEAGIALGQWTEGKIAGFREFVTQIGKLNLILQSGELAGLVPILAEMTGLPIDTIGQALVDITNSLQWIKDNGAGVAKGFIVMKLVMLAPATITAAAALGTALASISWPLVLIAATLGVLTAAWINDWGGIQTKTMEVWEGTLKPMLEELQAWFETESPIAIENFTTYWNETLLPAFEDFKTAIQPIVDVLLANFTLQWSLLETIISIVGSVFTNVISPAFAELGRLIGVVINPVLEFLSDLWENVLLPALELVWQFISETLIPVWEGFVALYDEHLKPLLEALAELFSLVLGQAIKDIGGWIEDHLLAPWTEVWTFISDKLQPVFDTLKTWFEEMKEPLRAWSDEILPKIEKAFEGIATWVNTLTDYVWKLIEAFNKVKTPPQVTGESPSPFETSLVGISAAMSNLSGLALPTLQHEFAGLGTSVPAGITGAQPGSGIIQQSSTQNANQYHLYFNEPVTKETVTEILDDIASDEGN